MVPDDSLTIRERAIAAWPTAWQGQNQRDILTSLGYDVDRPWRRTSVDAYAAYFGAFGWRRATTPFSSCNVRFTRTSTKRSRI